MADENEALDTAVSFLKTLSDHAISEERLQTQGVRSLATAWVRHLAIGAAHPETAQLTKRDFAGARRFVSRTLRNGHSIQLRTEQQLRDTAWGFASELHAVVAADTSDDSALRVSLDALRDVAESGSLEQLRMVTANVSRDLFTLISERQDRRIKSASHAAARLPDLLDALQRSGELSVDAATGLLDRRGLVEAGERVYLLGTLARTPVAVSVLRLVEASLRAEETNALMAGIAPSLSRAFLSRNDIVGREGDTAFAVISAGCDVATARAAGARARELVSNAVKERSAALGITPLEVTVGVAALELPVSTSLQLARPS